jgi:hypothetical protein
MEIFGEDARLEVEAVENRGSSADKRGGNRMENSAGLLFGDGAQGAGTGRGTSITNGK